MRSVINNADEFCALSLILETDVFELLVDVIIC